MTFALGGVLTFSLHSIPFINAYTIEIPERDPQLGKYVFELLPDLWSDFVFFGLGPFFVVGIV